MQSIKVPVSSGKTVDVYGKKVGRFFVHRPVNEDCRAGGSSLTLRQGKFTGIEIERELRAAAARGTEALRDEWSSLAKKHQEHFKVTLDKQLKPIAAAADREKDGALP